MSMKCVRKTIILILFCLQVVWCSAANTHILVHPLMVLPVVHAVQKESWRSSAHTHEKEKSVTTDSNFCLEEVTGKMLLKHDHAYYYQMQLQMKLCQTPHSDFIVWRENELIVERVQSMNSFWQWHRKKQLNSIFMVSYLKFSANGTQDCLSTKYRTHEHG